MGQPASRTPQAVSYCMRGAVLACFVLVAGIGTPPARAQAPVLPEVIEENVGSAVEFYASESGSAAMGCDKACQDLKLDYRRLPTAPEDPVPSNLLKSFVDKTRSFLKTPWNDLFSDFGRLTAAGALVTANAYVWKVHVYGPIERAYFMSFPKDFVDGGATLRLSLGNNPSLFPSATGDLPEPLPVGWVYWSPGLGAVQWEEPVGTQTCPSFSVYGTPTPVPAHFVEFQWHWNDACGFSLQAHGLKIDLKYLFHGSPDAQTAPDTPQTLSSFGQELTPQEIEDRLRTLLMSGDPDYEQLREWFCAVFGGECKNPKDSYPTTPDCAGETPAACTQAFRDAGFTGDITTQTLSGDLAQMEQDPGRVTDTRPHADLEIAQGREIIIYVNPNPLPTMTTTDTSIANMLATQNPGTVDETNKKTLAITCRKLTVAAGRSSSDCLSLPIFVVGKEAHVPAENDLAGLLRNPSWVALNARDTSNAIGPVRWYRNQGTPTPGCLNDEKFPANAECDEFPYWSTLQANNGVSTP
jgi:hypothetical protein